MAAPVTVAFVTSTLGIGGAERILSEVILRLDRRRFAPRIACLYAAGAVGEALRARGVPVFSGLMRHRWDARVVPRLTRWLQHERAAILYTVNQPLVQGWATTCAALARVPAHVTAVHSTGKINRVHRRLWVNRLTLSRVDRVIALSETHRRYLIEAESINARQLVIIPNGIDVAPFQRAPDPSEVKRELNIPERSPVVGIVAMLRPEKAHRTFLEAARLIGAQHPDAHFVVVGDGPERERLEAHARRLGLDGQVHWLGCRDDIVRLLHSMDVGVLSSDPVVETLPLAVLEYMAAGKPVVATRVGSVADLVEEGATGFVVPPREPQALAERIGRLLDDPALAQRCGALARQRVAQHYTMERTIRLTESLFDELLAAKGARQVP